MYLCPCRDFCIKKKNNKTLDTFIAFVSVVINFMHSTMQISNLFLSIKKKLCSVNTKIFKTEIQVLLSTFIKFVDRFHTATDKW